MDKELIKLILIKEIKESKTKGRSWGLDSIIPEWISKDYNVDFSDKELLQDFWNFAEELKREGFINPDVTQRHSSQFWILSEKAEKIYDNIKSMSFEDLEKFSKRKTHLLSDEDIQRLILKKIYDSKKESVSIRYNDDSKQWNISKEDLIRNIKLLEDDFLLERKASTVGFTLLRLTSDGKRSIEGKGIELEKKKPSQEKKMDENKVESKKEISEERDLHNYKKIVQLTTEVIKALTTYKSIFSDLNCGYGKETNFRKIAVLQTDIIGSYFQIKEELWKDDSVIKYCQRKGIYDHIVEIFVSDVYKKSEMILQPTFGTYPDNTISNISDEWLKIMTILNLFKSNLAKSDYLYEIEASKGKNKQSPTEKMMCFKSKEICPKTITKSEEFVFIGMPFRDEFQDVYNYGIKPVLDEIKKVPLMAAEKKWNIDIMCKVCHLIQGSKYGIINISTWNPNVLFELGLIYGLNKEAILIKSTKEREEKADLKGIEYVEYEPLEIDSKDKTEDEIEEIKIKHYEKFRNELKQYLDNVGSLDLIK